MFSRLVHSFSRPRGDSDALPSISFTSDATSARALFLPEILENIGWHLDQASLLQGSLVSRHWRQTLVPVLWYLVEIHAKDWLDLFDELLLSSLARNMHLVRTLNLKDLTERASPDPPSPTSPDTSPLMTAVIKILQLNRGTRLKSLTLKQEHRIVYQRFFQDQLGQLVSLTRLSL
ncbi:hypothetical protein BGZ92_005031, partial [Podila epicladia]